MNASMLTPELRDLVNAARTLSPVLVRQIADYADFLKHKHGTTPEMGRYGPVDESDVWSDEDLKDLSRHCSSRMNEIDPAVAADDPTT